MTDAARRKYWSQTMNLAYEFMKRASEAPVRECMEKLVFLPEAARQAGVEITFSDKPPPPLRVTERSIGTRRQTW